MDNFIEENPWFCTTNLNCSNGLKNTNKWIQHYKTNYKKYLLCRNSADGLYTFRLPAIPLPQLC